MAIRKSALIQNPHHRIFVDHKESAHGDYVKITKESSGKRSSVCIDVSEIDELIDALRSVVPVSIPAQRPPRMEEIRRERPNAYAPWTREQDRELELLQSDGLSVAEIATKIGRTNGAVRARLALLGDLQNA